MATQNKLLDGYSLLAIKDYVDTKVASAYEIKGSVANPAALQALPATSKIGGYIYNLLAGGSITQTIEGTVITTSFNAGDNVVWVVSANSSDGVTAGGYWDAISGFIDTSDFLLKTSNTLQIITGGITHTNWLDIEGDGEFIRFNPVISNTHTVNSFIYQDSLNADTYVLAAHGQPAGHTYHIATWEWVRTQGYAASSALADYVPLAGTNALAGSITPATSGSPSLGLLDTTSILSSADKVFDSFAGVKIHLTEGVSASSPREYTSLKYDKFERIRYDQQDTGIKYTDEIKLPTFGNASSNIQTIATREWVTSQGYLTSSDVECYTQQDASSILETGSLDDSDW